MSKETGSDLGAASNSLDHYRRMVAAVGYSITLPTAQFAPLTRHLTGLRAGIENAQQLLDGELQRLQRGVNESEADRQVIAMFREATK